MKPSCLKLIVTLPFLIMFGLAGCNTVEGFGKDMQKVGDKIEKKADEVLGRDEEDDSSRSSDY